MNPVSLSTNPFDLAIAFAFFCGPLGALLFANKLSPARQKELLITLGVGCLLLLPSLLITSVVDIPSEGVWSVLGPTFRLLLATAPKIIGASLFIVAGYLFNRLLASDGSNTAFGMHLGLLVASVFIMLNLPPL